MCIKPIFALTLAFVSFGQTPDHPAAGARELYYFGAGGKDKLPSLQKVSAPVKGPVSVSSAAARPSVQDPAPADASAEPAALHLGLRYNLALVDPVSGKSESVDTERVFKNGDCLAIEFDSNRSGYLYVLAKQSSGNWQPLFPSAEMSSEANIIDPGQKVRAPHGYCFGVSDPPGTETLFIVLSRDPRDIYELYQGIKSGQDAPAPSTSAPRRVSSATQMADARIVNNAVSQMAQHFGTRDLVIRKIAQPVDARDVPNSVYVVNASDKPAATVVTQLQIKHR